MERLDLGMNRPEDIVIGRATAEDAPSLSEAGSRLFEQTFAAVNDPEDMRLYLSSAFSVEAQTSELVDPERAVWIVLDSRGTAIGYAMLRRGSRADGITAERPAEVQRIYVDRAWHGRGVGDQLMQRCVE